MPTKIIADTPELDIADLIEEINSGITDPKQKILTGLEAEKAVGIQHEFAADIILQSFYFGIGMSFRAGDPPAYDSIRAPKAGTVLTKSSNHGLAKSLIPVDEMFTRLDKYHRPIGFDEKDKSTRDLDQMSSLSIEDKKKFQPVVPLRHSLRDLLEMTNENGDLEVNSYDKTSGELVLVYKQDKGPKGFQGQFIINISDDKAVSVDKRHYARPWNKPKPDAIPSVINGSFSEQQKKDFFLTLQDKLDKEFYVHYKKNLTDIPQPFKVYSDLEGNPITGDWDLLLVGHPKEDLSIRARTVFNTFATKKTSEIAMKTIEQNALFSATKKLFKDLRGKVVKALELTGKEKQDVQKGLKTKDEIEKSKLAKMSVVENMLFKMPENELNKLYHDASMERAGRITPFEYLQAILLNRVYATPKSAYPDKTSEFDPNIKDLIQHGAENRNPYAPSDLDGKILHVYKGLVILTQNQDQLIHFYLKTDFLRENLIDIHHGWPMDKWAPVLEKQTKLNQINLFDLNDVVNNTFEKRRVVQSYQDYHQMLRMEKMGKALVLNESNAQIIMRIMLSYQKVPENLMQKLADFYLNNDAQYLKKVAIDIKMNYKKYKWPIKIWGPVLEKQCQLEQQRGIEVVKKYSEKSPLGSMMQCYNNYKALLNVDLSKPLSPSTMKQIDEQLDFGQRESIPEKIFKRYEEMLQRPKTELASSSTESFNTQFLALEQSFKALSIGESSKSTSRGMTKTYDTISSNANALRLASSHMSVVDYNDYKNKRILVETQLADKIKNAKPDDPHFGLKIMTGFTTSEASDHLLVHIPNENDQKKPYELSSVYDRKKNTIEVKLQGGLSQKALVNMFNINKEFKPFELQPGNKPEKILEILKVAKDLGWSLDLDKNKSDLTLSADDISKLIEPQFKTQYEAILGIVPEKSQIENRTIGLS